MAGNIDSIVGQEAFDQVAKLETELKKLKDTYDQVNTALKINVSDADLKTLISMESAMSNLAKRLNDLEKGSTDTKKANNESTKAYAALLKQVNEMGAKAKEAAASLDAMRKAGTATAAELDVAERSARNLSKTHNALSDDLVKVNNLMSTEAKALKQAEAETLNKAKANIALAETEAKIAEILNSGKNKALAEEEKVLNSVSTAQNKLTKDLDNAKASYDLYSKSVLEMVANGTDVGKNFDLMVAKAEQAERRVDSLKDALNAYNNIQSKTNQLSANTGQYNTALADSATANNDYAKAKSSGVTGNDLEQFATSARNAEAIVSSLREKISTLTLEIAKEQKAVNSNVMSANALSQSTMKLVIEKAKLLAQSQTQAQSAAKEITAYEKLKKEYNEAATAAKNLGAEYFKLKQAGTSTAAELADMSRKYRDASKEALNLHNGLSEVEKSVGQSQRNVGNYNAMLMETTQIMRELPNFAISARTGIMALSNNLPMFAEQFQKVATSIDDVSGKKKGFTGALKEMGAAIFSWQGLLILSITLIMQFQDKITEAISKGSSYNDSVKKIREEARKSANEKAIQDKQELDFNKAIAESTTQSAEQRKAAIKKIRDENKELFKQYTDQQIMEGKVGDAYKIANDKIMNALEVRLAMETAYEYKKLAMQKKVASEESLSSAMTWSAWNEYIGGEVKGMENNPAKSKAGKAMADILKSNPVTRSLSQTITYLGAGMYYGSAEQAVAEEDKLNLAADKALERAAKYNEIGQTIQGEKDKKEKKPKKGKALDDDIDQILSAQQRVLTAEKEYRVVTQEAEAAMYATQFENEEVSYERRIQALDKYLETVKKINAYETADQLSEMDAKLKKISEIEARTGFVVTKSNLDRVKHIKKTTRQERDLLREKIALQEESSNLSASTVAKNSKAEEDYVKRQNQIYTSSVDVTIRNLKKRYDSIDDLIQSRSKDNINALTADYNKGGMTYNVYDRKRKSILAGSSLAIYLEQLEELDKMMLEMKDAPNEVKEFVTKLEQTLKFTRPGTRKKSETFLESIGLSGGFTAEISQAKDNLNNLVTIFEDEAVKKGLSGEGLIEATRHFKNTSADYLAAEEHFITLQDQANQKLNRLLENSVKGLVNSLKDLAIARENAAFENRMNQLDAESKKIAENAEAEKTAIETSMLSAEEKEKKLAEITASSLARQKQLEKEQKILEREKAIREKKQAQFEAGINGAMSIIEAIRFSKGNPVKAAIAMALIAAMVATQIASLNAKALPAYQDGVSNHPGGPAIVGEIGTELGILPSGKTFLTPSTATIMDLPRGTQIIPHDELGKMSNTSVPTQNESSKNPNDLMYIADVIKESIASAPQTVYNMVDGEMTKTVKTRTGRITYLGRFKK